MKDYLAHTDIQQWCLFISILMLIIALVNPTIMMNRPVYQFMFIVDITGSMNVHDYRNTSDSIQENLSRLDKIKLSLPSVLSHLPCQSKVGLGVFSERTMNILFEPIEVCHHYHEIVKSINALDWRMAWAGDSNIAQGLYNSLEELKNDQLTIVFFTDGHEAPPTNPRYKPDFNQINVVEGIEKSKSGNIIPGIKILSAMKGPDYPNFEQQTHELNGLLVGVGNYLLTPIPKYDVNGQHMGFYTVDEVPHATRFGLSNEDETSIDGYEPRNAPFGRNAVVGNEHLSSLKEDYLLSLCHETGFEYHHLESSEGLETALLNNKYAKTKSASTALHHYPAIIAFVFIIALYLIVPLINRL